MKKRKPRTKPFEAYWPQLLGIALVAGIFLRILYVNDMEYKEDEQYNFTQSQLIGTSQPWPWYGIPSGVYLVNPGMSIWIFAVLAKLFQIHDPTHLAYAVQLFALFGMALIVPFAWKRIPEQEQSTWFWAFALAMVNPFLVLYQRKLWPEGFLPFFTMLVLMGWWARHQRWGAFIWGAIGACLGQIHMSGFFFSGGLFLWTFFFDRPTRKQPYQIRWNYWFLGSIIGALPLIPWLIYAIQHPPQGSMTVGWNEILQLKYWVFWFTDPLGLHLGNPLGLLRGPSHWDQISDFVRYPVILNQATYLVGIAHLALLGAATGIFGKGIYSLWKERKKVLSLLLGRNSDTLFVQNAALFGCGLLLSVTGVVIRRYYLTVTYPLEFLCLIRMADAESRWGRRLLITLWIAQLFVSANFVGYIHVNHGSLQGDYGEGYAKASKSP